MRKRFVAGLAVMTLLLAGATRARAEYIVTSLPMFEDGSAMLGAALNDSGQVAGSVLTGSYGYSTKDELFFSQAVLDSINSFTYVAPGGNINQGNSSASGINNAGQVVGILGGDLGGEPFLYSNGKITSLGTSGLPGYVLSEAIAINDKGQIVAAVSDSAQNGIYLYSNGKWTPLVAANISNLSISAHQEIVGSLSINASGQIAGTADGSAFLYSGGKMINLGSPGFNSGAFGINDSGQVVGVDLKTGTATLFSGGKSIDLGTLASRTPGGGNLYGASGLYSMAFSINNAGQIVGTSSVDGSSIPHAFLYSDGKMTDLDTLISLNLPKNFILTSANAINNNGQILATGIYTDNPNVSASYLLTPTPEPGTLTLLTLGALGLGGHAWRSADGTDTQAPLLIQPPLQYWFAHRESVHFSENTDHVDLRLAGHDEPLKRSGRGGRRIDADKGKWGATARWAKPTKPG